MIDNLLQALRCVPGLRVDSIEMNRDVEPVDILGQYYPKQVAGFKSLMRIRLSQHLTRGQLKQIDCTTDHRPIPECLNKYIRRSTYCMESRSLACFTYDLYISEHEIQEFLDGFEEFKWKKYCEQFYNDVDDVLLR